MVVQAEQMTADLWRLAGSAGVISDSGFPCVVAPDVRCMQLCPVAVSAAYCRLDIRHLGRLLIQYMLGRFGVVRQWPIALRVMKVS